MPSHEVDGPYCVICELVTLCIISYMCISKQHTPSLEKARHHLHFPKWHGNTPSNFLGDTGMQPPPFRWDRDAISIFYWDGHATSWAIWAIMCNSIRCYDKHHCNWCRNTFHSITSHSVSREMGTPTSCSSVNRGCQLHLLRWDVNATSSFLNNMGVISLTS